MEIKVHGIPPQGREVEILLSESWVVRAVQTALEAEPVQAEGLLLFMKRGDHIQVTGQPLVQVQRACDRCGRSLKWTCEEPLTLDYVTSLERPVEGHPLDQSSLDLGVYNGVTLSAELVLQEHLALVLPFRVTCEHPGVHLPDGATVCTPLELEDEGPDPRMAALRALLDN